MSDHIVHEIKGNYKPMTITYPLVEISPSVSVFQVYQASFVRPFEGPSLVFLEQCLQMDPKYSSSFRTDINGI